MEKLLTQENIFKFFKEFCKTVKEIRLIRKIIILSLFIMLVFNFSFSREKDFGLGIILGEPTGISLKKWVTQTTAIDGGIAWSFTGKSSLHLHMDYLFHNFNLLKTEKGKLPFYYGIGCRIKAKEKSRVGIRIPVGISYIFDNIPIDIFFELSPLLDLIPATEFGINASIGCRYYF